MSAGFQPGPGDRGKASHPGFAGVSHGRNRATMQVCSGLLALFASFSAVFLSGCRSDMQDQPKMYPQRGAALFADGRSVRPQVPGTVARSQGKDDLYQTTGMVDGKVGDALPFPVSSELLARGQERFNIYCSPCHSRVGNGKGAIVERGYYRAASFHSERLRQAPLGYFFRVISEGYGAMPSYYSEIAVQDRWAIVAYIRALQLSQNAKTSDVPAGRAAEKLVSLESKEGFTEEFLSSWGVTRNARTDGAAVQAPAVAPPTVAVAAVKTDLAAGSKPASIAAHPATTPTAIADGANAPAKAATVAKATPVAAAPKGDAAAGAKLYAANCSMCHQPNRAGLPPVFPSLLGIVGRVGEAHIRETLISGKPDAKPPMPSFSKFSPEEVDDLLEFLRTK